MNLNRRTIAAKGLAIVLVILGTYGVVVAMLSPGLSCPSSLVVSELNETNGADRELVEYSELSEKQQSEFKRELDGERVEVDSTADEWKDADVVRCQGENYPVGVAVC